MQPSPKPKVFNMAEDYPLRVQSRNGVKRWGTGLRVWALETAVDDADYVAENMYDGEVIVVDTRNGKTCYSTKDGHNSYIPAE